MTVTAATTNSLTTTVPAGATTGPISITVSPMIGCYSPSPREKISIKKQVPELDGE
jgi:hypothetical protein